MLERDARAARAASRTGASWMSTISLHLLAAEPAEDDHLVEPVQELGPEVLAHLVEDRAPHELGLVVRGRGRRAPRSPPRRGVPEVRRQDDDRVLEVDRAPLPVGEPPVVEHLEQHVPDVRVRLLDLVEEDHAVRPPAHRLGELPALLVPDVARAARR